MERTLILLPQETVSRMDKPDPRRPTPKIDNELPSLEKVRTERELP
jgi:hypothetical protein